MAGTKEKPGHGGRASGITPQTHASTISQSTDLVDADGLARLRKVFPAVNEAGGDVTMLAREADLPADVVGALLADPGIAELLAQDAQVAESDGTLLASAARRIALRMLRKIEADVQAGDLDADDIGNLLPKVHRVLEHAERMQAEKPGTGLPMFNIIIGGGGITVDQISPEPLPTVERLEPLADGAAPLALQGPDEGTAQGDFEETLEAINAALAGQARQGVAV